MIKRTIKPKKVKVLYEKEVVTYYIPRYQCPTCKTIYKNAGPNENVTRFICACGQELIVEKP